MSVFLASSSILRNGSIFSVDGSDRIRLAILCCQNNVSLHLVPGTVYYDNNGGKEENVLSSSFQRLEAGGGGVLAEAAEIDCGALSQWTEAEAAEKGLLLVTRRKLKHGRHQTEDEGEKEAKVSNSSKCNFRLQGKGGGEV